MAPDGSPEPMKSHEMTGPWEKVHVDLCGPFPTGESILGIIDANSRWPDIHIMKSTASDKIVDCLDKTFTTHGYPGIAVTDNAPDLTHRVLNKMERRLFCYISPRRPLAKIEVRDFNFKNCYVHRRHSSKKRKSPESLPLSACIFRKILPETEVPVIFVFLKNARFKK